MGNWTSWVLDWSTLAALTQVSECRLTADTPQTTLKRAYGPVYTHTCKQIGTYIYIYMYTCACNLYAYRFGVILGYGTWPQFYGSFGPSGTVCWELAKPTRPRSSLASSAASPHGKRRGCALALSFWAFWRGNRQILNTLDPNKSFFQKGPQPVCLLFLKGPQEGRPLQCRVPTVPRSLCKEWGFFTGFLRYMLCEMRPWIALFLPFLVSQSFQA